MLITNENLLYLILLVGLVGLAYGIRLVIALEHRLLALERRNIELDERIEALILKLQKTEQHLERHLYKKR